MRNEHTKIWDEFHSAFPESPDFAGYLTGQVIVRRGTLRVARLMVLQLRAFRKTSCSSSPVTQEMVNHFACEERPDMILSVSRILTPNTTFIQQLTAFQVSVRGEMHVSDKTFVHHNDVPAQVAVELENVFRCACAMLYGHKLRTPSHGFRL